MSGKFYSKRYLLLLPVFCFMFGSLCGLAQEAGSPNVLDKDFVPDSSSVFNTNNPANGFINGPVYHNVIEFTPGLLFRNIFALQYERQVLEGFSLQGSLGMVYGVDRWQQIENPGKGFMSTFFGGSATGGSTVTLGNMLNQGKSNANTAYLGFAVRWYYTGFGFLKSRGYVSDDGYYYTYHEANEYWNSSLGGDNSVYMDFGVRYFANSLAVSNSLSSDGALIQGVPTVQIKSTFYFLNWGYHYETKGKIPTTHNIFIGVGLRYTSYDLFIADPSQQTVSGPVIYNSITSSREHILRPTFQAGYEFGLGF